MRSLITKWDDLREPHCVGDRLTVFVRDARTGEFKMLDLYVSEVAAQGDAAFDEERDQWPNPALETVGL